MKVKNFHRGNYQYISINDGCVYYGKITMTLNEFLEASKVLMRCGIGESYERKFMKQLLREDLQRRESIKGGFNVAIRVSATEKLFEKFNLPRYKRQNYFLEVLT